MQQPDPDAVDIIEPAQAMARILPLVRVRPVLVTSDFDGTLSMPKMDPWAAAILPRARWALRRLAATPGVHVALLSGRTAGDLSVRVRVGGADYLGNQGLERGRLERHVRAETLVVRPHPAPARSFDVARSLIQRVPEQVTDPWLVVESKLPAVTFHYRAAPDVELAARQVRAAVDRVDPAQELVRHLNRRSLELRPPGAPAKGEAFRILLDEVRPAAAFMLGDDRTDVAAFRVLRAARTAGEIEGAAIAVARDALALAEAGPHADIVLAGPIAAARLLAQLSVVLGQPS